MTTGATHSRAVTKIMRFFFLMAIKGRFKNIFSRLELCIKIFYYSRKTLRISVTFIGVCDGGKKKKKRSTTLGHEPEHQPLPPLDITRSNTLLMIQPHCI